MPVSGRRACGGGRAAEIVPLAAAIGAAVHDGDVIAMEGFTHLIPMPLTEVTGPLPARNGSWRRTLT